MTQLWKNLGTGGAVLDAQAGSSSGADSNDPTFLAHTGTNYLYLPGVAGNYASTPDAAALDITGDLDIRVRVAMDDWTPAANTTLLSKDIAATSQRSYTLNLLTDGRLQFAWSADGSTAIVKLSTSISSVVADGGVKWVRVTLDVDNGSSQNEVKFFTSDDGSSWTQLGTTVTTAGATSIYVGTAPVRVGCTGDDSQFAAGKFYRAQVRSGIDGTVVFDADFTTGITSGGQTTFTESSSNAATVTINRSTSGRKAVAVVRNTWLLGTDDYFEIADNALLDFGASDSFTVIAIVRQWATPSSQYILSKGSGLGTTMLGYVLYNNSTPASSNRFGDGTNRQLASDGMAFAYGPRQLRAMVRDTTADNHLSYVGTTAGSTGTDTTTATLENSEPFRIGSASASDMEVYAVLLFRRALTAAEIGQLVTYYGT